MKHYEIYVGGEFRTSKHKLDVSNPFTGKIFAQTYNACYLDIEEAIGKAENVKEEMRNLPAFQRYEILKTIAEKLTERRKNFAEIIAMEAAKPIIYALAEVDRAITTFAIAAEESKRIPREYLGLDWTPQGEGKEGMVKYFPVGLVAAIAPFNFPLNLAVHKVAPAIAAGCPVILKPASHTPLATLELAKIIDATTLPKGAFSVLPMERELANKLVRDERFGLLTFTGSPDVGWKMKKDVGKKKLILELGGNAGVIVTSTADIDWAVKRCVIGGFAYSGQVCIHAQRIFVDKNIINEFSEKLATAVKSLSYGDPLDKETQISVMIDEQNAIRIESWVNEAISDGAQCLCGGKRNKNYYEPTILTNTKASHKVNKMEVFGPVVTVEPYTTFEEAVERLNDTNYGLQAGLFTNDIKQMDYAFNNVEVGGLILNDTSIFRVDQMPYGGVKDSGLGREGVKYAIIDMLEAKILVK